MQLKGNVKFIGKAFAAFQFFNCSLGIISANAHQIPCRYLLKRTLEGFSPSERPIEASVLKTIQSPKRSIESIETFRVGTLNSYNLYVTTGKYEMVVDPATGIETLKQVTNGVSKTVENLESIATAIKSQNLDVVILQEVEGIESLLKFNHEYLGGEYEVFIERGNDFRGIEIAMLVKKDLPFKYEYVSHADLKMKEPLGNKDSLIQAFSRDFPVLKFYADDGSPQDKPLFAIAGVHFKSKRDRPGDPESKVLRAAQVRQAEKIILNLQKAYGENFPILVGGDFNGHIHYEEEFDSFLSGGLGLSDTLRLANPDISAKDAVTHTWHPSGENVSLQQLDAILVNDPLKKAINKSEVYRYKDAEGHDKPLPTTRYQRDKNPSDHFPVWAEVDFKILIQLLKSSNSTRK
jgi:endonuclease/exonuclease/phosphatase family metal-dependent hydrolase